MKHLFLYGLFGLFGLFGGNTNLKAQNTHSLYTTSDTTAQTHEPMVDGQFKPTWESLSHYQTPQWYQNAKFGIWAHWGPQCQPEQGDWFARGMYEEGSYYYKWFMSHYGSPSQFGFKDIIHDWKAQNWNPDALVKLYKQVGAQYFVAMANHHDNFDMWNSKYHNWNSVNMGPQKDIIAGWAQAAKKYHLPFGVSIHAAHAWLFYETAQGADKSGAFAGKSYDGVLTKADGKGKWWDGLDPQELYAQNHERNTKGNINEEWEWGNGAVVPSEAYCDNFYDRTMDLINKYDPQLVYFDDTALPLWPVSDVGLRIAANFYNRNMKEHHGKLNAVIFGKKLTEEQKKCLVWDVERGAPDKMQPLPWQTCSCLGNWHYDRPLYERNGYKSAQMVVQMLVDIVSKNGNLLLNVPVRGDGTIDEKEVAILEKIGDWMHVNSESIFDTHPWKQFGEGPIAESLNPMVGQGFNEGKEKYTSQDVRFTSKKEFLYAIIMVAPQDGQVVIKSLSSSKGSSQGEIKEVTLLGSGKLKFEQTDTGLHVSLPAQANKDMPLVLKIKTHQNT